MRMNAWRQAALAAFVLCASAGAQAALFEDDEARRAILDLRQRVEAVRHQAEAGAQENAQLRRSLVELQQQIDGLRGDLARMTGQNEQLTRTLTEIPEPRAPHLAAVSEIATTPGIRRTGNED